MASTKYATSACAVRRPSLDDLSPMRSPVAADVLARTKRGRNHRGRRRCSNSASNHWLGTESYSAERSKEPASPNTALLDEPEVVGTVRIVGRLRRDSSESSANAITCDCLTVPGVGGGPWWRSGTMALMSDASIDEPRLTPDQGYLAAYEFIRPFYE